MALLALTHSLLAKDGSWNSMISAHPTGQIFVDLVICPYCSMGEECNDGQIPPESLTGPLEND